MLQRLRTMAGYAANGTAGDAERRALQVEANALILTTDAIANGTRFNERILLVG